MGSSESSQTLSEFKSGLIQQKQVNHLYLGEIQLWNSKANIQIFSKKIPSAFINEKNKMMYDRRKMMKYPNIIKVLYLDTNISQSNIDGFWEYPGDITIQELNNDEPTIWRIIHQIVQGGAAFQMKGFYHGDLKPQNIFWQKDRILLAESTLIPGLHSGYQKFINRESFSFLSPQELESAKNKETKPKGDRYKSDVYAFGMTILELLTRQNSLHCYDFDNFAINQHILHQRFQVVDSEYSQCLQTFLHLILQQHQDERPTFIDLNKMMEKLSVPIQTNQPFYKDFVFCNCPDHSKHKMGNQATNAQGTQTEEIRQQVLQQKIEPPSYTNLIPLTNAKPIFALVVNPASGEVLGEINVAEPVTQSQLIGSPQSLSVNPSPQRVNPNFISSPMNQQKYISPQLLQQSPQQFQERLMSSPQQFKQSNFLPDSPFKVLNSENQFQNQQENPYWSPSQLEKYNTQQQQLFGSFIQQQQQQQLPQPSFQHSQQQPTNNQFFPSMIPQMQYTQPGYYNQQIMHNQNQTYDQSTAHFGDNTNYSMVKDYTNKELDKRVEKALGVSKNLLEKLDYSTY